MTVRGLELGLRVEDLTRLRLELVRVRGVGVGIKSQEM